MMSWEQRKSRGDRQLDGGGGAGGAAGSQIERCD